MDIQEVFKNNLKWVTQQKEIDSKYFEKLSAGQRPEILYIGCSDSRVTAEELMGARPGEVFIHRNIANMVSNLDVSAMSVINYAVKHLEVQHVVICGHYDCGGIKAAMEANDLGLLNPWLRSIRDIYRLHKDELNAIDGEKQRYDRLVELNVQEQCVNVLKSSDVQIACHKRQLTVHGWVFDIYTGKLIDLDINVEHILAGIEEIYRLT